MDEFGIKHQSLTHALTQHNWQTYITLF